LIWLREKDRPLPLSPHAASPRRRLHHEWVLLSPGSPRNRERGSEWSRSISLIARIIFPHMGQLVPTALAVILTLAAWCAAP